MTPKDPLSLEILVESIVAMGLPSSFLAIKRAVGCSGWKEEEERRSKHGRRPRWLQRWKKIFFFQKRIEWKDIVVQSQSIHPCHYVCTSVCIYAAISLTKKPFLMTMSEKGGSSTLAALYGILCHYTWNTRRCYHNKLPPFIFCFLLL